MPTYRIMFHTNKTPKVMALLCQLYHEMPTEFACPAEMPADGKGVDVSCPFLPPLKCSEINEANWEAVMEEE